MTVVLVSSTWGGRLTGRKENIEMMVVKTA